MFGGVGQLRGAFPLSCLACRKSFLLQEWGSPARPLASPWLDSRGTGGKGLTLHPWQQKRVGGKVGFAGCARQASAIYHKSYTQKDINLNSSIHIAFVWFLRKQFIKTKVIEKKDWTVNTLVNVRSLFARTFTFIISLYNLSGVFCLARYV